MATAVVAVLCSQQGAAQADPIRARLEIKRTAGGRSTARKVERRLRSALRATRGLELASSRDERWAARFSIRVRRIKRRGRRRYRLAVSVTQRSSGRVLVRASTRMSRAVPSSTQARKVLARAMRRYRSALAEQPREPVEPPSAAKQPQVAVSAAQPASSTESGGAEVATSETEPVVIDPGKAVAEDGWATDELSFQDVPEAQDAAAVKKHTEGTVVVHHYRYLREPATPPQGAPALAQDAPAGRDSIEMLIESKATTGAATAMGRVSARRDFSDPDRDRVNLVEGYGAFERSSIRVRAGYLIEAWGAANLYNPSDILNPRDVRDPLDPEKLATWMIRADWLLGPVSVSGYYLPIPDPHLLPVLEGIGQDGQLLGRSRWIGGSLASPSGDAPTTFLLGSLESPSPTLDNAQGALRLAATGSGIDFAVSYAYVFDHFATANPVVLNPGPPATMRVDFAYNRQHVIAAEAETVHGRYRLAAEAIAVVPRRAQTADSETTLEDPLSYTSATLGVDYQTAQFRGDHQIHLFVDLALTRGLNRALAQDPLTKLRLPFRRTALARLRYDAGRDLRFKVDLLEALDGYDLLVSPSVSYRFGTMMRAEVGLTWLDGDGAGFFGANKDNSRVSARLEASY